MKLTRRDFIKANAAAAAATRIVWAKIGLPLLALQVLVGTRGPAECVLVVRGPILISNVDFAAKTPEVIARK